MGARAGDAGGEEGVPIVATSWIPAATNLARKPKVLGFARSGGICRHAAAGLLVDFWGYVSEESNEGFLADIALSDLPSLIGGNPEFWSAVAAAEWISEVDAGLQVAENKDHPWLKNGAKTRLLNARRQSSFRTNSVDSNADRNAHSDGYRNADSNADRNAPPVTTEQTTDINRSVSVQSGVLDFDRYSATPIAIQLYRGTGSKKRDDPFLWQISVLVAAGMISSDATFDALSATKHESKRNPVGYFRNLLASKVGGTATLNRLLKSVKITKHFPREPPTTTEAQSTQLPSIVKKLDQ